VTETKYPADPVGAMDDIAKIDALWGFSTPNGWLKHPAVVAWTDAQTGMLARLRSEMALRGAHPARTVVLLPYAQLRPLAARLWTLCFPDGFAPRFETTMSWSTERGGDAAGGTDIAFDVALDTLTARVLLAKAGLAAQQDALAGMLVLATHQLAPLAAACSPADRAEWAQNARIGAVVGMDGPALAWEAAVVRIAVEWAAVSAYVSDVLFTPAVRDGWDCLLVVQGFSVDPLMSVLQPVWGDKWGCLSLAPSVDGIAPALEPVDMALHACRDAEDEAQRSAACALRHIEAGRTPVALVSSDRALTRRVRAMLDGAGVQIRDENGWKLSTSHAAAQVMAFLKACEWNASTDGVLNWLKSATAFAEVVDALEAAVRRNQVRDWRQVAGLPALKKNAALLEAHQKIHQLQELFKGSHTLAGWLAALRTALQTSGVWAGLQADGAGAAVLAALRLADTPLPAWDALQGGALWGPGRMDLAQFTHWVNLALEGASFSPPYPEREEVVILPMSQMLGRPFAAVVLAGCDEVRMNPSPEPPGGWTAPQRAALGLPSRETLDALARAAWYQALQTPVCDVLWRTSDDAGETLLPSALVQLLQLEDGHRTVAADPRVNRRVASTPVLPPQPIGALVPVQQLSASAYEDLRQCPYRFFALRQLGLKAVDELDAEVDKRDFGLWLHEVLKRFHEALAPSSGLDRAARRVLIDAASLATTHAMALPQGEFLPFAAAWPAVREGYLDWLLKHEASGAVFFSAETAHTQSLGDLTLVGRIDRIDTLPDGTVLVVDYKTEPAAKTSSRVKDPLEDTQMAFYAALLPHDTLQGAYVNVGERDATRTYPQPELVEARDALIEGMLIDMQNIREGVPLPALGEGVACDYCSARGLCRKDFWA